jgi:ribosomal protein S18 acetylase RimI-like enzyme
MSHEEDGMSGIRIVRGVPAAVMPQVVSVLVDAFPLKVEHELGTRDPGQARRLITRGMDPRHGWVALDDRDAVVGVAGVAIGRERFTRLRYRLLAGEFGIPGALPRWVLAAGEDLLTRPRRDQWRVEVLAVAAAARGAGIGTSLLTAVGEAARAAGAHALLLEVVDTNERALKLYERLGFRRRFTLRTGWLTARGGYRAVHFMRLDLPPAGRSGPPDPHGSTPGGAVAMGRSASSGRDDR